MSRNSLLHVFVLSVLFISPTFIAMGKNPVLKNSKWTAVQKEFVADAGTMTITTEDGHRAVCLYQDDGGFFTRELPWGETLVFSRSQE